MQIVCGEDKYNYDLPNDGTATFFPLNMGNGTYTFRLMEQVGDSKYACIGSEDRDVTQKEEFQPYLRPNQMVNYNKSSDFTKKVKELAASCTTDADIAAAVYDYMVKNIQYDTEKAATVQNGYLPSPDETLRTGKGICFDYASLAAAMLRSEGIPCVRRPTTRGTAFMWRARGGAPWRSAQKRMSGSGWTSPLPQATCPPGRFKTIRNTQRGSLIKGKAKGRGTWQKNF